jgi:hypothetical protein
VRTDKQIRHDDNTILPKLKHKCLSRPITKSSTISTAHSTYSRHNSRRPEIVLNSPLPKIVLPPSGSENTEMVSSHCTADTFWQWYDLQLNNGTDFLWDIY